MSFNQDYTAQIAMQMESYAYILAGQLAAKGAPQTMVTQQIAAGVVAKEVYLANALGDSQRALNAMRLMNEYSNTIYQQARAGITGGAYWHSMLSTQDQMNASLSDIQNRQFIDMIRTKPIGTILAALNELFNRFNQFLAQPH